MTWKLEEYDDCAGYRRIRLLDSNGYVVSDSESYYPKALERHHGEAMESAMNLISDLAVCENDALTLAHFKGWARAILETLDKQTL